MAGRRGGVLAPAGVALVSVVSLGLTPTVSAGVQRMAEAAPDANFVRGARIGSNAFADQYYIEWADHILSTTVGEDAVPTNVPHSGSF